MFIKVFCLRLPYTGLSRILRQNSIWTLKQISPYHSVCLYFYNQYFLLRKYHQCSVSTYWLSVQHDNSRWVPSCLCLTVCLSPDLPLITPKGPFFYPLLFIRSICSTYNLSNLLNILSHSRVDIQPGINNPGLGPHWFGLPVTVSNECSFNKWQRFFIGTFFVREGPRCFRIHGVLVLVPFMYKTCT